MTDSYIHHAEVFSPAFLHVIIECGLFLLLLARCPRLFNPWPYEALTSYKTVVFKINQQRGTGKEIM